MTEEKNESENKIDNNIQTFNTLQRLQNLYKQESELKDIFLKMVNERESEIQKECNKLITKKIEILNLFENLKVNKNEKKKYLLLTDNQKYFGNLNEWIEKFLEELWKQPEFVANLIINSKIEEIKNTLSLFIMNNFYQNLLSPKNLENNLLYVIFILLKNEINNLSTYKDLNNFLENSPCGLLLRHFIKIKDINIYFKNILHDIIEKIEKITNNKVLLLEAKQIKIYNSTNQLNHKKSQEIHTETSIIDSSIYIDKTDTEIIFVSKQILHDFMIKSDNQMKEYCFLQMNKFQEDSNIYSYESEIDNFKNSENSENKKILNVIIQDAYLIKYFIEKIIQNLINNFSMIPYEIKCISKMISILLIKKFPKINKIEENAFISKFFFNILLNTIFKNPATSMLINDFILSNNTISNLGIISSIILKLVSGYFYTVDKDKFYTIFNQFFLIQMPFILSFFEKLSKVELPSFIEKLLKEEKNYNYNYFEENKEQFVNYRSILYNINDIWCLLENINNNKEKLFIDKSTECIKKIYELLFDDYKNKEVLNKLKNKESNNYEKISKKVQKPKNKIQTIEINGKKIIKLFLIIDLSYNEKCNKLITQKEKIIEDKNNILTINNYFGLILKNYIHFSELYYDLTTKNDTIKILEQMKSLMESSHYITCNKNKFPIKWYINALIESLNKTENSLKENDFKLLLEELENNLNSKIKAYNIGELTLCFDFLRYCKDHISYYEDIKNVLIDIDLNQNVKNIIEKEKINVEIIFKYTENAKEFKIEKLPKKQQQNINNMVNEEDIKNISCETIKSFIKNFPSLRKYQTYQDKNLFEIQKQLQIPQKLEEYFSLIEEYLSNSCTNEDNEDFKLKIEKNPKIFLEKIKNKIREYVMNNLFDKIFPVEPSNIDNKIFQQSITLSWVKPNHFIKNLNNVYDIVLPEISNYLTLIDMEGSPSKKLFYMSRIFEVITNLLNFDNDNPNNEINIDEYKGILVYSFIKAKLTSIHSNLEYMKLYTNNENEQRQLNNLINTCNRIKDIGPSSLSGISVDEYIKNCNKALNNN